jgi:hypothetical protein
MSIMYQRGAGLRVPFVHDALAKTVANSKYRTTQDKELKRLDIHSKMLNMKELVSWVYLENGEVANAIAKSPTSTITQIGKRFFANPYTVPEWFDKNFINEEQLVDFFKTKGRTYCDTVMTYLKQLNLLITGSNNGFPVRKYEVLFTCMDSKHLPDLDKVKPSNDCRVKLSDLFGEDVMNRFIDNYQTVRRVFIETLDKFDKAASKSDSKSTIGGTKKKRRRQNKSNKRKYL